MKMVVGLGNPGAQYENTRHNAGFLALRYLASKYRMDFSKSQCDARTASGRIMNEEVILVRPQTFMNLSGKAVKKLADKLRLSIDDIIVIHDDLDLPVGKIRIKKGGGTGGHNGLESIKETLGNASFTRLKIGIDRPMHSGQVTGYVLSRFSGEERQIIDDSLPLVSDAVGEIIRAGVAAASNKYNEDPDEKKARAEAKEARRLPNKQETKMGQNDIAQITHKDQLMIKQVTVLEIEDHRASLELRLSAADAKDLNK